MKSKLIYIAEQVESTEDCVKLLNEKHKAGKWKRKTKFKLPNKNEVRVFADGNDVVSVVVVEEGTILCPEVNLSDLRPLIDRIETISNKLYSFDGYGSVWLNPYEMRLWITGSDSGIEYAETIADLKERAKNGFEYRENHEDEVQKLLPELKVQYEAEADPFTGFDGEEPEDDENDFWSEQNNFINIAKTKDAEDVIEF